MVSAGDGVHQQDDAGPAGPPGGVPGGPQAGGDTPVMVIPVALTLAGVHHLQADLSQRVQREDETSGTTCNSPLLRTL